MKKIVEKKKMFIHIASFVLSAFLILNCVWGLYSYNYINNYTRKFTTTKDFPVYLTDEDGFSYAATNLKYLSFINNLSVSDENLNGIIIWIKPFSTVHGIIIMEDNRMYQMYLDKDGNPIDKRNPDDAAEKYNEIREIIEELIKRANEFWSL